MAISQCRQRAGLGPHSHIRATVQQIESQSPRLQDLADMKYTAYLLAAATIAIAAPAATTLPQLGGVNTAGYDFSVVRALLPPLLTT